MSTRWIPKGFHTITPNIVADDAEQAVAFLKKALGATETYRLTMSSGKIAHCELKLGDSVLNIGESMEGWPARGLVAQIYVEDSDELFKRAVHAGAKEIMSMTDMFFGSREGRVQTMDIALQRAFRLSERANFQFRAEAFNALNKVNLGTPNRYVNEPQFGTITMAMTPGREIQLSARVSF